MSTLMNSRILLIRSTISPERFDRWSNHIEDNAILV